MPWKSASLQYTHSETQTARHAKSPPYGLFVVLKAQSLIRLMNKNVVNFTIFRNHFLKTNSVNLLTRYWENTSLLNHLS